MTGGEDVAILVGLLGGVVVVSAARVARERYRAWRAKTSDLEALSRLCADLKRQRDRAVDELMRLKSAGPYR